MTVFDHNLGFSCVKDEIGVSIPVVNEFVEIVFLLTLPSPKLRAITAQPSCVRFSSTCGKAIVWATFYSQKQTQTRLKAHPQKRQLTRANQLTRTEQHHDDPNYYYHYYRCCRQPQAIATPRPNLVHEGPPNPRGGSSPRSFPS